MNIISKKHTGWLVLMLILCACEKPIPENTIVFDDLSNSTFVDFLLNADIQVIPLSTEKVVTGDFQMVKYIDGEFFLFSQQEGIVHRFSTSGDYINSVGKVGDGPEEYRSPADFIVAEDNVIILSQTKGTSSIYMYSTSGSFKTSFEFSESTYSSFALTNDGYIFSTGGNTVFENNQNLHTRDFNGNLRSTFHPIKTRNIPSVAVDNFTGNGKDIYYLEPFNNTVYRIEKDSLIAKRTLDFGSYNLKNDAFEGENSLENFMKVIQNGVGLIQSYFESNEYLYFSIVLQKEPEPARNFHLIAHKKSGVSKRIESIPETAPAFQFTASNQLLFVFQPQDLLNLANGNPQIFELGKEVIESIKPDDNPVILLVKPNFQ